MLNTYQLRLLYKNKYRFTVLTFFFVHPVQSQSISLVSRTGQNIIYQDFSSIYKRIVYSKRLEMLDLITKKGNCTIFAAKIKAWNSWMETSQPICSFVIVFFFLLRKHFFLLMLLIINCNSDVRCALHV